MSDLLLELLSEEIPARMQAKARADLARLLADQLAAASLRAEAIETYSTPRRLALIARGLPLGTPAVSEELKGPRTSAPPQALEGFLRKTGLAQDQLEDRAGIWFAVVSKPGRATIEVLAEAIPAIVRAFPWPKSMRWGAESLSTESLRWVRPLQGVVAMFDEEVIDFEIGDVRSGAATVGHRFHHPGPITLAGASDYIEKLRACHVIVDHQERAQIIRDGAAAAAAEAGLALVPDEGLVEENAGLTEWPVPLLGRFDPAFLEVPREVIQLTMRTNQKYFAVTGGEGVLAPAFLCVANIAARDGGARIVEGNQKVLAARLSDARFFWEQDLRVPLEEQAAKLGQIVFHEKLGTVADKVERVAKLARWLVEEGIVGGHQPSPGTGEGRLAEGERGEGRPSSAADPHPPTAPRRAPPSPVPGEGREKLATLAERAARLCKADLVTQMVGEFPELQGLIGGYLAAAQGEDPAVAAAIRDHYKPVGQGDEVPTAPVTVAVSLADKLDTLLGFFARAERPTGSKDPFALRRAALGILQLILRNRLRLDLYDYTDWVGMYFVPPELSDDLGVKEIWAELSARDPNYQVVIVDERIEYVLAGETIFEGSSVDFDDDPSNIVWQGYEDFREFLVERLKVQQRANGVRHDVVDAVFALSTGYLSQAENDLVRLLARVRALQAFVETQEGADLLAGYKRAANILKKEGWGASSSSPLVGEDRGGGPAASAAEETPSATSDISHSAADAAETPTQPSPTRREGKETLSYTPEKEETALIQALDGAEPRAAAAIEQEDFEAAMAALATLRAPVDAFFEHVTVNDPAPEKRAARLDLLARMRAAFHRIADFSKIEG